MDGRTNLEARRRGLLREVEQALLEALSESHDIHVALWNLQRAGYSLRLSVECVQREEKGATSAPGQPRIRDAAFRIDAEDLRFLRSIGIDPTRKRRSRHKG